MTLDEAIKRAKGVAEEQDKAAKEWHENQVRKCKLISGAKMDYTRENECKKCAEEHRQLAKWLIAYKNLLEEFENAQIITGGRLNGRTYAYKCGLEDGKRKALEQEQKHIDKSAMMCEIYMEGVNMTGEYQGCWVRFKNIEKIVNKYM